MQNELLPAVMFVAANVLVAFALGLLTGRWLLSMRRPKPPARGSGRSRSMRKPDDVC